MHNTPVKVFMPRPSRIYTPLKIGADRDHKGWPVYVRNFGRQVELKQSYDFEWRDMLFNERATALYQAATAMAPGSGADANLSAAI
jgi:hypothetical protein